MRAFQPMAMQESSSAVVIELKSLATTRKLGELLAQKLTEPTTVALCGTLGSGKTELTRSIAIALGVPSEEVTSPTYVLVHRYAGRILMYHVDLYRLKSLAEVWDLGLDEFFESKCVTIIEWADKFEECLPDEHIRCELDVLEDGSRTATFTARGQRNADFLSWLASAWTEAKDKQTLSGTSFFSAGNDCGL